MVTITLPHTRHGCSSVSTESNSQQHSNVYSNTFMRRNSSKPIALESQDRTLTDVRYELKY